MTPIINTDLLSDCWAEHPETETILREFLKDMKSYESLESVLASPYAYVFKTADEKEIIFRITPNLSVLVKFHDEGVVEIKDIHYRFEYRNGRLEC